MSKFTRFVMVLSLLLCSYSLLAAKSYTATYSQSRSGSAAIDFDVKNIKIKTVNVDGENYSVIEGAGDVFTEKKGFASVPFINATVALDGNQNVSVKAEGDYEEISLDYPLLPSRGVIYRNQDPSKIAYSIDPASVTDSWYPQELAQVTDPFVFRDVRGVNVYAYPVQYNAKKQSVRIYKKLTVITNDNVTVPVNPLPRAVSSVDPAMGEIYQSLFLNYGQNSRFSNQVGEFGEMLLLYTARDAATLKPFIDWKREKGIKVTTRELKSSEASNSSTVKQIIKDAYSANNKILYVQLVGDWADIKSELGTSQGAPMDPMLGCVVGTDLYPELIVGRFSCSNETQLKTQIDKAINYEKNPDTNTSTNGWYKNALGIASSEGPGDDSEIDYAHMDVIRNKKLLVGGKYTNVYQQYQPNETLSATTNYINNGLSLINYVGHGSEESFVTSGYSNDDINESSNQSKLPFIFSVACVNGKFHQSSDCFAEAWLKKSGGGAVATIMSTINQPWVPPMKGQDYMNDLLTGGYSYSGSEYGTSTTTNDARTTFGAITFNGTILMLAEGANQTDSKETIQTWTIFGDASLQVRTDKPKTLSVTPPSISGTSYSLSVKAGGVAIANALVSLSQNEKTYSALTNSSGVATISHAITSGSAKLTVTGYNTTTYQTTLQVGTPVLSVNIASPDANSTVKIGETVNITADAFAPSGTTISKVDFYINNSLKVSDTSSPYSYSWNTNGISAGAYTIKTVLTDNQNKTAENSITVNAALNLEPVTILSEGFEGAWPPPGWSINPTDGGWFQAVKPVKSGSKSAGITYYHNVSGGATLTTSPLKISGSATLEFWWSDKDFDSRSNGYDHTYCEVSTNGTTWKEVAKIGDDATMSDFVKVTVDLTPYQGNSVYIRWRDVTQNNSTYSYGSGIDDIVIKTTGSAIVLNAPTNLVATPSGSKVTLNWSAPTRALSGYNVYRNGTKINSSTITQTTYSDNSLANGEYTYTVTALYTNPSGESAASNSVNAKIGSQSIVSNSPPTSTPIRTPAEFEPVKAVVVQWDFTDRSRADIRNIREYNNLHNFLIKNIQLAGATAVVMVSDESVKSQITAFLQSNGTPLTNVLFQIEPTNDLWVRDYSATTIYYGADKTPGLVDWEYNRARPLDDESPVNISKLLNTNLFRADENSGANKLIGTGGNFMTDGFGLAVSSKLIVSENGNNETKVKQILKDYMGIERYSLQTSLLYDDIHHIDMHMKLLDEETILVGEYPQGVSDGPRIEANLQTFLTNFKTVYGRDFRVVKIPMLGNPSLGDDYRTYTNSLIVNNYILVPIYGVSTDEEALNIYRKAMPGYTVLGFNSADIITRSGAIHCITHEVNKDKLIRIKHPRFVTSVAKNSNLVISAELWSNEAVNSVKALVKFKGQSSYAEYNMTNKDGVYSVSIPATIEGEAQYYIKANSANAVTCKPQAALTGGYYTVNIGSSDLSEAVLPQNTELYQNYPNPFNPQTTISFFNKIEGAVSLAIYNINGEEVAMLTNAHYKTGNFSFTFNASSLNSGVYFYRLKTPEKTITAKMMLVK